MSETERMMGVIKLTFQRATAKHIVESERAVVANVRASLYDNLRMAGLMPKPGRAAKSPTAGATPPQS